MSLISESSLCLGELNGIGRTIQNPYLLIRPLQRKEAVASSNIEGTITSLSDLFLFEAGADERERPADTREVHNYVRALETGIRNLEKLPVCLRLITEMHDVLLRGVSKHRGAAIVPGELRKEQNWIGNPNTSIKAARFVPPPPQEVAPAISDLEKFIHADLEPDLPQLVRAALVHYQFETIHPFPDGNGRVGRLLIPLILYERKCLSHPMLYLSPYFERHHEEYVARLYEVSKTGAWIPWIEFFLKAVVEQSRDTTVRVQKLQDLQAQYRAKIQKVRATALALRLVDLIFETPIISIPRAQSTLGVTYRGAKLNVEKLIEQNILTEFKATGTPKFYMAPEVMKIIQAD